MKDAKAIVCYGEAHSNAYIDHCGVCLGHTWGGFFACPTCTAGDGERSYKLKLGPSGKSGACPNCRKRFNTSIPALDETLATLQETARLSRPARLAQSYWQTLARFLYVWKTPIIKENIG